MGREDGEKIRKGRGYGRAAVLFFLFFFLISAFLSESAENRGLEGFFLSFFFRFIFDFLEYLLLFFLYKEGEVLLFFREFGEGFGRRGKGGGG